MSDLPDAFIDELTIVTPYSYSQLAPVVDRIRRLGISESEFRNWLQSGAKSVGGLSFAIAMMDAFEWMRDREEPDE